MKGRWKWILVGTGVFCLAMAFVLALWSFRAKDDARRLAGKRLDATRDAAARIVRDLVAEGVKRLDAKSPPPTLAPFDAVGQATGADANEGASEVVPDVWLHFGPKHLKILRRVGTERYAVGWIPLAELDRRLAADPAVGKGTDVDRWWRLSFVERDGDVVWSREAGRTDEKAPKSFEVASEVRKRLESGDASAPDDAGEPPAYKSGRLVRGSWASVFPDAKKRVWALVEVRDEDVVAGVGGRRISLHGLEFGELMPWHLPLALGILFCLASVLFWLPQKGGADVAVLLRTYAFARPYRWGIGCAIGVGALYGLTRASRALIAKKLVDDVFITNDPAAAQKAIWIIVLLTLGIGVVTAITNYFKEYLQNFYATSMMADVRLAVARKIVSLPLSFFNRFRSGELLARIERDGTGMRQVLLQVFDKAFVAPFVIVGSVLVAFMMNWRLACVLFGLPLIVIPVFKIARKVKKRATKRQNLLAEISHIQFQMLTGIKVVKAFHGEEREAARLYEANRRFIHEARRIARLMAFSESLLDFLQMVGGAIVVYLGGQGVVRGEVQVGDLVGFVAVIISIYDAAKDITQVVNKMTDSLPAVTRVYEILDVKNDLLDGPKTMPSGPLHQGVELRDVRFRYLESDILKGVNLFIPAGKVVAIVGPTGAGKTTLCDLVARFYDPTEGAVLWDGVDAREYTTKSLVANLAIVTQDAFLFNAPLDENVRYGREDATQAEIEAAAKDANVHDEILLMDGGYAKNAGERGMALSGGQRQRVTIARALIKDAPVLILDEATSNLDSHSEKRVQEALARLMKGRTTIVVAHRLSTIRNADKVVIVDDGRIVEEGAPEDLLKRPGSRFRAMWDLQTGGRDDGDAAGASA